MPDKQKVTLYISDELHRQFKIRSAVDGETMSSMAQRALEFYLGNAELVDNVGDHGSEVYGKAHQVHSCPQCSAAVALRGDGLSLVHEHSEHVVGELSGLDCIPSLERNFDSSDEGELITC